MNSTLVVETVGNEIIQSALNGKNIENLHEEKKSLLCQNGTVTADKTVFNKLEEEEEEKEENVVGDKESVEEEDEEEEEDVEPKLKYERIGNNLRGILCKDAASAIAVHPKFLCLGSHWGVIYLLDHQGNSVQQQELPSHAVAVNKISIDSRGDYVASCSDDGRVVISSLTGSEKPFVMNFDQPVKSIAIDQAYGRSNRFITGDNSALILHELAFFNRVRSTVLADTEGAVYAIEWRGHFVAWQAENGVRVYDLDETQRGRRKIGVVKREHDSNLRPELFPCHLCWKDDNTLLVGWADTVKVCEVAPRSPPQPDLHHLCLQIKYMFVTDFFVAGVGPLDDKLVLLGFSKEYDAVTGKAQRPQLYVVEPDVDDYSVDSADILSIRGHEEYRCSDYHLVPLLDENLFFVVSPKDVVVARPRDADDHVQWLLQRGRYPEAMSAVVAGQRQLKRHSTLEVGRAYMDHLLDRGEFDAAGRLCLDVFGREKRLWQEDVYKFAKYGQLRAVSPYLPCDDHYRLDPHVYEMVLYEFLKSDMDGFLKQVKLWSPVLYNVPAVINAVLEHLLAHQIDNPTLLQALATLYSHSKKYDKAMAMYLRLKHEDVFLLIEKHELFTSIPSKIEDLMRLNPDKAITMFLQHMDQVAPSLVVKRLESNRRFLFLYLDALYKKESKNLARRFHGMLVDLYATFDQSKLLPFLRSSDQYPIQEALDICQKLGLVPEMVYLLGRMGNTREALQLITQRLMDVQQAIAFCKEHDDADLWDALVAFSLDKPPFVKVLLMNIGTHVDPQILIRRIPTGMEIPGLRDALAKIMHDYNLQISLQEGYKKILVSDCVNLHTRVVRLQQRGVEVEEHQVCGACHRRVLVATDSSSAAMAMHIIVFYCRHCFHESCLPRMASPVCTLCHSQRADIKKQP